MTEPRASESPGTVAAVELEESGLASWAAEVGREAVAQGLFVCLHGPLGAGKSTFVRSACRGAGVVGSIPSPTFTLLNRYSVASSGRAIWHADLYRLDSPELLVDVGWPDLVEGGEAVFVEWAERAGDWLPHDRWEVTLSFVGRPDARLAEIRAVGSAPPPPLPAGTETSPC
jgi:tRNA threonylcarbamoyladenosine biosynthesis protein TsaE